MQKYLIGVDCGGTKTEAVAYNLTGQEIGRGMSGPSNLLFNRQQAITHILQAIQLCREGLLENQCVYLCLGIAGISNGLLRKQLRVALKPFASHLLILSDVQLAHAGALQGKDGIVTIAGTGSVSWGCHKGVNIMVGGWGHLLGDEGSGYWIVMELVKHIFREADKGNRMDRISRKLLSHLQIENVGALKEFVYLSTKSEIAALAPFVDTAAREGDCIAKQILSHAGEALGKITVQLWQRLRFQDSVDVAMKGGIFMHIPLVREAFSHYVQTHIENMTLTLDDSSATKGAYYLFCKREHRGKENV